MKSYSEFLSGGQSCKLTIGGKLLYVQNSGAGALDISFYLGQSKQTVSGVSKGFKAIPVGGFDQIELKAAADGFVQFIVTDGEVNAQFDDASTIIGNDDAQPVPVRMAAGMRLPVDIGGGVVQVTASNVSIGNTDAAPVPVRLPANAYMPTKEYKAATVVNVDPVNMTSAAAQIIAADVTRRGVRMRNTGQNAVAIGGAGLVFSKAVTIIQPGETWAESEAGAAAWFGVCDAGLTSTLNIQVIG